MQCSAKRVRGQVFRAIKITRQCDDALRALRYRGRPVLMSAMNSNEPSIAQRQVLSPTRLVAAARDLLERGLPLMWIEGEVSNFMRAKSGHLYFTLKDIGTQVRCAMFKPRAMHLRFAPGDGQQVLVRARVTLYEPRGEFQLQIEHMEEAGLGALQRQFDELKARLDAEGLFAAERKRALPAIPHRIAVITSPTGAAIRDVLAVIGRRFPLVEIDLFPTLVQGSEAPAGLRKALLAADAAGVYDVIVLTRGGGSIEDLWAFNSEALARAIHACATPVVSAVGHEIDFTIADFVADLRAPTPSAAAELVVPDIEPLRRRVRHLAERLASLQSRQIERLAQRVDGVHARLQLRHPLNRLAEFSERLARHRDRLTRAGNTAISLRRSALQLSHARLQHQHPRHLLAQLQPRPQQAHRALQNALAQHLRQGAERLRTLARTLNALNPLATLDRGYAIVFDAHGNVVRKPDTLSKGDLVQVRLADGQFDARVITDRNTKSL